MKKYWQAISNIGVEENLADFDIKRIKLLNKIALLAVISVIPHTLFQVIIGNVSILLHSLIILVLSLPILWFHYQKQYYIAKVFSILTFMFLTMINTFIYGWQGGGKFILLYSLFLTLVLFDKKREYIVFSIVHIVTYLICELIINIYAPLFQIEYLEILSYCFIGVFIYFTVDVFRTEQQHKEYATQSLIDAINNKNNALMTQRQMVKYQNDALKKANLELQKTQDQLTASNEDLRTFAYIVSHDLKEPLRMINSYTQLLKRRFRGKLDEDTSDFMFYIIDGSRRMKEMLDDLLQYATAANKEVHKEEVNLKDAIEVAIKNLKAQVEEKQATIELGEQDFPAVHASFSHMTQLFQNLIGNAMKFHKPDLLPLIEISVETKGSYYIIRISDNGIGIPREKTDRIFSPFERVGHNKVKGTGIGLAICKKIVENHNGKIWVESDTNEGANFFIALPKEQQLPSKDNESENGEEIATEELPNVQ